ncbi:hypothetical protein PG993_003553 [Apiospora rasikravindrae]|uniref:Uncharacterized protein n=1 Tax=Apiospora rasikravindrae TaxID=990691 RepID=A0ABR1TZV1_9PEZI
MAQHAYSRTTTGEPTPFGVPQRSVRRPEHRVPALGGPQERAWTSLDDPRESYRLGHHGSYRDGHPRPLRQHERPGTPGRREGEAHRPLPPKTRSGGEGHRWLPKFRGSKEREMEKETKRQTFDRSLISRPLPADPGYLKKVQDAQRRIHEPVLNEMGMTHAMDRQPMNMRPIARADANTPERPVELDRSPVAAKEKKQLRRRPTPHPRPRDSGDSLSRLSTTAVIDEPDGVINPLWMPRRIDAMAAGYTGFPEWSDSDSIASVSRPSSPEQTKEEVESLTSRRNKRLGRIFTSVDLTEFPEIPESPKPAAIAGEDSSTDGEKLLDTSFDVVEDDSEDSMVEGSITSDDELSDSEPEADGYNYLLWRKDQGITGEIISGTRRRPAVVVHPPTPSASPPPSPSLPPSPSASSLSPTHYPPPPAEREEPVSRSKRRCSDMDPFRLRVERAWKMVAEDKHMALCQTQRLLEHEQRQYASLQKMVVPLVAAFEEIVACSDEFRGLESAMEVPAVIGKILDERDDALDEADSYVHRSLGLESQLRGVMTELVELRAENKVLRVDNARLRNVRSGSPLDAGVTSRRQRAGVDCHY